MEPIKESLAQKKVCPIVHAPGGGFSGCQGAGCMAWVSAKTPPTMTEVPWPADIVRPRISPDFVNDPLGVLDAPTDPREYGLWARAKAEEALKPILGGVYADTGRRILAATPVDMKLTSVRLTLEAEPQGHCSLIR